MKYKTYVTDAYMVYNHEDGGWDWPEDEKFDQKHVETHKTLKEAHDSMADWGSKWAMYSGVIIEDEEGSEVYSSIPAKKECKCCHHVVWDLFTSDMRKMKNKDGKLLFLDLQ